MDFTDKCSQCRSCQTQSAGGAIFAEDAPRALSPEQMEFKRALYEKMNPRRRKFIDRIGYEQWDPFQEPKQPLDLRRDRTARTLQELINDFMRQNNGAQRDAAWQKGAAECALGIIQKNEKYQGIYDFCLWYSSLLAKEGHK